MSQDNKVWPVTKKSNPKFVGLATVKMIAENPNLVLVSEATLAVPKIEKAKEKAAEQAALDANPGLPSEAVSPADVLRKPKAS